LTDDIEEITHDENETPTFGVVDDGRTYPAVTARRRQQSGSTRSTLYTVSKNGQYAHLYPQFERDVIEPYRERKRKRAVDGGSVRVNTGGNAPLRNGKEGAEHADGRNYAGVSVNSVDG
jgi:hypothetical protein